MTWAAQLPCDCASDSQWAEVTSARSSVKNVPIRIESGGENARTWNVHLWEKAD